jgi:hypothetical protein
MFLKLLYAGLAIAAACESSTLSAGAKTPIPDSTAVTVAVADKFLASLSESQRSNVVYDFNDSAQRKRWSNLPTKFVKRGGLRLGDLTKAQRGGVDEVLKASLSAEGYTKVHEIVQADESLKQNDGNDMFGADNYYVSFVGQPSAKKPWMLQFGGHHLGINVTFVGDRQTLAPSHTGAQPALYEIEGKTIRPLGHETDKAFALLTSLSTEQRKRAILGFQMHDLVLGPGRDGKTIEPEGIKGSGLSARQKEMLLDLASEWTGILKPEVAKSKNDDLREHVDDTWFSWSGPTNKGGASYFRLQGPTVLIEYAPQRLGGDPTKHIHTIYRDPGNDYGAKWWKQ